MPRKQLKVARATPSRVERLAYRLDKTLEISDRDREAFFEALINPPKASERLVRALAGHKQRVAL